MCWVSKCIPKIEIATEDIYVKKVLYVDKYGILYSPVFVDTKWDINNVIEVHLGKPYYNKIAKSYKIDEGIHSCKTIFLHMWAWTNGAYDLLAYDEGEEIFDAVIPKGSYYYINEYGDCVSDKLKIIKTNAYEN